MKLHLPPELWTKARQRNLLKVSAFSERSSNPPPPPILTCATTLAALDLLGSMIEPPGKSNQLLFIRDDKTFCSVAFARRYQGVIVGKLFDSLDCLDRFVMTSISSMELCNYIVCVVTLSEAQGLGLAVSDQDVVEMIASQGIADPHDFILRNFRIDIGKDHVVFALVSKFLNQHPGVAPPPDGLSALDHDGIRSYVSESGVAPYVADWVNVNSRHMSLFGEGCLAVSLHHPECNVDGVGFGQNVRTNDFYRGTASPLLGSGSATVDAPELQESSPDYSAMHNVLLSDIGERLQTLLSGTTLMAAHGGVASGDTPAAVSSPHANTGTYVVMDPNVNAGTGSPGFRDLLGSPVRSFRDAIGNAAHSLGGTFAGRKRSPPSPYTSPSNNHSSLGGSPMSIDSSDSMIAVQCVETLLRNAHAATDAMDDKLRQVRVARNNKIELANATKQNRDGARKESTLASKGLKGARTEVTMLSRNMKTMLLDHQDEVEEAEQKIKDMEASHKRKLRHKESLLEVAKTNVDDLEKKASEAADVVAYAKDEQENSTREVAAAESDLAAGKKAYEKVNEEVETVQRIVRCGWVHDPTPKELRLVVTYYLGDRIPEEFTDLSQVVGADNIFDDNCLKRISYFFRKLGYVPPIGYGFTDSNSILRDNQLKLGRLMGLHYNRST